MMSSIMSTSKNPWFIGLALSFTLILWASAFVGIRIGLHAYTPGEVAFLRYFVASIAIFLFYIFLPQKHRVSLKEIPALFVMGIMGIGIYNIALNYGEITVSAGIASFIIGIMPVITMIQAIIFLQERVNWRGWVGVSISLIGMTCILTSNLGSDQKKIFMGIFDVFIAALMGSSYTILQKYFLKKYHPIEVTAFAIWSGTLILAFYAPGTWKELSEASLWITWDIVYMGLFPGAIAYGLWCYALNYLPASKAVSSLYVLPLISTLMGYLILGEKPHWLALLGGLIALSGAVLANTRFSSK